MRRACSARFEAAASVWLCTASGDAVGVVRVEPLAVAAVHYRAPARLVGKVPVRRFAEAFVEPAGRRVAQFGAGLALVDRIEPVVAGAIGNVLYQLGGR